MMFFFFNETATTEIYTYGHTLSLHEALPMWRLPGGHAGGSTGPQGRCKAPAARGWRPCRRAAQRAPDGQAGGWHDLRRRGARMAGHAEAQADPGPIGRAHV